MHDTMANAMLDDDFKTSHPDLTSLSYHNSLTTLQHRQESRQDDEELHNSSNSMIFDVAMKRGVASTLTHSTPRKSVDFAILPSPKRTRASCSDNVPWTAKQVVEGAYLHLFSTDSKCESDDVKSG
jgi:hypothetical protein